MFKFRFKLNIHQQTKKRNLLYVYLAKSDNSRKNSFDLGSFTSNAHLGFSNMQVMNVITLTHACIQGHLGICHCNDLLNYTLSQSLHIAVYDVQCSLVKLVI